MEFWSQLAEDAPDCEKLSRIGSKINSSIEQVKSGWIDLNRYT